MSLGPRIALLVVAASVGVSCAGQSQSAETRPGVAAAVAGKGLVIDGERFCTRQILDPQQGGIPVGVLSAPEKWRFNSRVAWNYEHTSNPVSISASAENPDNDEAFYAFPAAQFFSLRPDAGFYQPGQNLGGLVYTRQPGAPAPSLLAFIQQARAGCSQLQVVGSKDLPDLPAALRMPPSKNLHGVGIKVTYDFKGRPVEEEFYAVYYSMDIPYDGPQGRTWQINWGLNALHSFRAPKGALDRRRPVFAAAAKSFRPNPAWQQRLAAVNAYLAEQFNQQLRAGYDSIAAAGRLSRQISADNDAMIAAIDRQLATTRSSGTDAGGGSGRSGAEKFDDYIRGVDTVDDPYYGTSQHASTESIHWTDGYGAYRHSNDATYDPNLSETGDWKRMPFTR